MVEKHGDDFQVVSLSYDETRDKSIKALKRACGSNRIVDQLKEITGGEFSTREELLSQLNAAGMPLKDASARRAVNALLNELKVPSTFATPDPVKTILGDNGILYLLSEDQQALMADVRGGSSLPFVDIIGRDGKMLFSGRPRTKTLERLISKEVARKSGEVRQDRKKKNRRVIRQIQRVD